MSSNIKREWLHRKERAGNILHPFRIRWSESYPFLQQIIAQFVLAGAQVDYTLGEEEEQHWLVTGGPKTLDATPHRLTSGLSVSWYLSSE